MESGGVTLRVDTALWLLPASATWCCSGECWETGGNPITCILLRLKTKIQHLIKKKQTNKQPKWKIKLDLGNYK
jgi:hypothetical protein